VEADHGYDKRIEKERERDVGYSWGDTESESINGRMNEKGYMAHDDDGDTQK
jgi:hypothetical protein